MARAVIAVARGVAARRRAAADRRGRLRRLRRVRRAGTGTGRAPRSAAPGAPDRCALRRDAERVSAFCLLVAGVVRATLPGPEFTLAWQHSVAKTRWEERYRVEGDRLLLAEACVEGTGAGMEPPPEAVRRGGRMVVAAAARAARAALTYVDAHGRLPAVLAGPAVLAIVGPSRAVVTVRPCNAARALTRFAVVEPVIARLGCREAAGFGGGSGTEPGQPAPSKAVARAGSDAAVSRRRSGPARRRPAHQRRRRAGTRPALRSRK